MADVNYTKPTGDIKVFIDKFNIELDKAIKELNSAQANLKNIYSDAIKVSTPRSSTWPKDDSVKTIGDLFKYTFPDISTNTFIEPPDAELDYIISNSVDSAKMEDYNSWQKDLTGTELNKMFFKSIKNGLRANEKLNGFNQFKKPGITNPSLYSPGQYWFDVFMYKVLSPYGPIFSSNSYIKRYADEKGLSASISIFSTSGDKETNKLNYSDFSTYILQLGKNIGDINVDIESTTSDGFFSGLRTQYKSGLISVLEKDPTFDFERGEEGSLTGEFIGNYEQMFLYKAFIQAGDNYKPVVLPYRDVKSESPVTGTIASEPTQPVKKPDTQEYTFNVEKKDTFIVVGGTVSPPLELVIVPNDGTAYIFDNKTNNDNFKDLDEEYVESDFEGSEELAMELEARSVLQSNIDPNIPDQSGKMPNNSVSDVDFKNPKYTGGAWKGYDINTLVSEIDKTKYKPSSKFKESLKKILLWMKTDDLIKDPREAAYLLGTAFGESGYSLQRWEADYACSGSGIPYGTSGPCSAALNYYKKESKNKINYYTLGTDRKGFPYFGRGLIQLTGKGNYELYGKKIGADLLGNGDLAIQENNSYKIAVIFLSSNTFDKVKKGDLTRARKSVNGGTNGIDEINGAYKTWISIIDKTTIV